MGRPRIDFHNVLLTCTDHVYFQPPATVRMSYPCIVYERDSANTRYSGDVPYLFTQRYLVTVVDLDPDSEIIAKVAALPMSQYNRHWVVENVNHDAFVIYY